jgi:signal transduction histidine kinase
LRDLAERQAWQTPCRLELKTELHIESDQTAAQLYRILREALVNANKHASATKIVVGARRARDELVLSVEDNGVGLPEKIKSRDGLGFHSMRHRAELIGARLEVRNRKESGTRVAIYLKNGETHTTNKAAVSPVRDLR